MLDPVKADDHRRPGIGLPGDQNTGIRLGGIDHPVTANRGGVQRQMPGLGIHRHGLPQL